jgi:hypothetical protein
VTALDNRGCSLVEVHALVRGATINILGMAV